MALKERYIPAKINNLCSFEAELENIHWFFEDGMAKLLMDGKFPENYEELDGKVNWHNIL